MNFLDWLLLALAVMAIFDWTATLVLLVASLRARRVGPPIRALESRCRTAAAIAVGATLSSLVIAHSRHLIALPADWVYPVVALAVLVPSSSNLMFLIDLWRDKF